MAYITNYILSNSCGMTSSNNQNEVMLQKVIGTSQCLKIFGLDMGIQSDFTANFNNFNISFFIKNYNPF